MLGAALVFRAVPARVVAGLVALSLALPGAARANGDPASDILLQQKVYLPVQRVSPPTANRLQAVVREANAKGYPIRVALIEDANDLGTVPDLLNQPQKYADFLAYTSKEPNSNRVGEFAIGTNIAVRSVIGNILQDEKLPGLHLAFGHPYSEHTGAAWSCRTHLDIVGRHFDVWMDDEQIMADSKFLI